MVGNTVVLRPPRTGRTCVFGRVMGGFVERWLEVRICFSNGVYVSVGDTDMFSPPTGGVCGAYAVAPLPPGICHTLNYGYVFRTGYASYIKIRTPLPNPVRATHRKTRPIFQHLANGGNHDREVWPTFGAVHFKNNVLKTYL